MRFKIGDKVVDLDFYEDGQDPSTYAGVIELLDGDTIMIQCKDCGYWTNQDDECVILESVFNSPVYKMLQD